MKGAEDHASYTELQWCPGLGAENQRCTTDALGASPEKGKLGIASQHKLGACCLEEYSLLIMRMLTLYRSY